MPMLGDLGAEPLLTAAEEQDLAVRIEAGLLAAEARRSGSPPGSSPPGSSPPGSSPQASEAELRFLEAEGEQARQRFVRANLRLVAMVALPAAARSRLPEPDLFQEGCLGLLLAVQRYDHRRPARFATYALFWIRAYVGAATARGLGELNVPTSRAVQLRTIRAVEGTLAQTLGREATVAELAAAIGRTPEWTADLVATRAAQPLDAVDLDRLPAAPDDLDAVLDADRPGRELLARLDPVGRRVLELRLGFTGPPQTYVEVSRTVGLPLGRVRRIERRALSTLRSVCPQGASVHLRSA